MKKMTVVRTHGALIGCQLIMVLINLIIGSWFIIPVNIVFIFLSTFMINVALRNIN